MINTSSMEYVRAFEANINNLEAYQEIHLDTSVDYYCVQLEGFEVQGNIHTSNGSTLYGAYIMDAYDSYILKRDDCVVVGPAGEVCLMSRALLCSLFLRPDGSIIDMSRLRGEYDWFTIRINPRHIGSLCALAVPRGYILNTAGLRTDGGYDKKGHGTNDYIVCANMDLRKRYIVNGVILGLESLEGKVLQPKVKPYVTCLGDLRKKIELN